MLPNDYERTLKDEIYGCFKHIGIPIETVFNMPIQDRRYYILKHNEEQERRKKEIDERDGKTVTENGDLNAYARNEQSNNRNYSKM
jgi:hypothetical protein